MEELYPDITWGSAFKVRGFAVTFKGKAPWSSPKMGEVTVNFVGGRLLIRQASSDMTPTFLFEPLTRKFLAGAIGDNDSFQFSLRQERLASIELVNSSVARDMGSATQTAVSLDAAGRWGREGLTLSMQGEMGEFAYLGDRGVADFVQKQKSY